MNQAMESSCSEKARIVWWSSQHNMDFNCLEIVVGIQIVQGKNAWVKVTAEYFYMT